MKKTLSKYDKDVKSAILPETAGSDRQQILCRDISQKNPPDTRTRVRGIWRRRELTVRISVRPYVYYYMSERKLDQQITIDMYKKSIKNKNPRQEVIPAGLKMFNNYLYITLYRLYRIGHRSSTDRNRYEEHKSEQSLKEFLRLGRRNGGTAYCRTSPGSVRTRVNWA
jgi:hypothetical protein